MTIQDYDIALEHISGKRNVVADYLSRHIVDELIIQKKEEILEVTIIEYKGTKRAYALKVEDIILNTGYRVIDNVLCKKSPKSTFPPMTSQPRSFAITARNSLRNCGPKIKRKKYDVDLFFYLAPTKQHCGTGASRMKDIFPHLNCRWTHEMGPIRAYYSINNK